MSLERIRNFIDLTGKTFGRLEVKHFVGQGHRGRSIWECFCSCGNLTNAVTADLRNGTKKSCGCLQREMASAAGKQRRKHGGTGTPEYRAWKNMNTRCYCLTYPYFADYGGRGITVCDKWRRDYLAFLADVGERPSPTHSLDRIRVNGNYEPGNVRWATPQQQRANRRDSGVRHETTTETAHPQEDRTLFGDAE